MTVDRGNVYQAFISLLRAGMWGVEPDSTCFPLRDWEWEQVYLQARRQTVEGILYDGVRRLPLSLLPPRTLLMRWTVGIDTIERRNARMNRVVAELNRWFRANGLEAWLLKGQGVARCYAQPLRRLCGDIDWYFPHPRDYDKAVRLLKAKGIHVEYQPGFSLAYQWGGFLVEHHRRLIDLHNPLANRYLKHLIHEESAHPVMWCTEGESILLPSPVLTHIQVNAHILKHMLAFGIGIRQLCDSARVCCRYHDRAEGARMSAIYRKTGIFRWTQLLHRLLVEELGMPAGYLPFPLSAPEDYGWMMEEIWQGGNFGFFDARFSGTASGDGQPARPWRQLAHRLRLHFRYVPAETCWFPLHQACSHLHILWK